MFWIWRNAAEIHVRCSSLHQDSNPVLVSSGSMVRIQYFQSAKMNYARYLTSTQVLLAWLYMQHTLNAPLLCALRIHALSLSYRTDAVVDQWTCKKQPWVGGKS